MSSSRTELAKMGKYIAKLRKDKKYTQRQLGDMIDIPYKTISKWENGVIAPDITVLQNLANVLNVTVDELLCGEEIKTVEEKNLATVNGIKIYIKKSVGKILKIMGLFLIILFICIAYFYSVENHYKWNVIDLSSSNNDLYVNGYIIFNKDTTMVVLDELAYTSNTIGTIDEPKVKSIDISLYFGDKKIISDERFFDEYQYLHYCFEKYYFIYDEKKYYENLEDIKLNI